MKPAPPVMIVFIRMPFFYRLIRQYSSETLAAKFSIARANPTLRIEHRHARDPRWRDNLVASTPGEAAHQAVRAAAAMWNASGEKCDIRAQEATCETALGNSRALQTGCRVSVFGLKVSRL